MKRPAPAAPSLLPPSLHDDGSEGQGLSVLEVSAAWYREERRLDDLIAWATIRVSSEDEAARSTLDVVAALAQSLHDLRLAIERCATRDVITLDVRMRDHVRAVLGAANEALLLLVNRYRRHELWMFWMLAEAIAVLPRIDVRHWVSHEREAPSPTFGVEAALVNAAVSALSLSLRDLAAPRTGALAQVALEDLERYIPSPESLRETTVPPSRKVPTAQ